MPRYNILLLNNTEKYHNGCKTVIDFYRNQFKDHNLTIADRYPHDVSVYDLVVANGEGSMHSDCDKAWDIVNLLVKSSKSMLVNTVWQNNSIELTEMLKKIDYVSVREISSQKEIQKQIGITVPIELDYSYFQPVGYTVKEQKFIVAGNRMNTPGVKPKRPKIKNIGEDGYIDIFKQSWNDIISQLKNSDLLVTGRHHEMYAACKAGCPFVVLSGNTHKNEGLFATAGVNIPTLPFDATNDQIIQAIKNIHMYKDDFKKLFSYMSSQPIPNLLKNARLV